MDLFKKKGQKNPKQKQDALDEAERALQGDPLQQAVQNEKNKQQ